MFKEICIICLNEILGIWIIFIFENINIFLENVILLFFLVIIT